VTNHRPSAGGFECRIDERGASAISDRSPDFYPGMLDQFPHDFALLHDRAAVPTRLRQRRSA
jgi:hypothetical protein